METIFECTGCGHVKIENVVGKTTSVCDKCQWPTDVMEDGSTSVSPLALARGYVTADNHLSWGICYSPKVVRTVEETAKTGPVMGWSYDAEK
jgi:hypothetical protein